MELDIIRRVLLGVTSAHYVVQIILSIRSSGYVCNGDNVDNVSLMMVPHVNCCLYDTDSS